MISVVIPNYKRTDSLIRSLNSVFSQTYMGAIEIIVVDDCSPNYLEIETEVGSLKKPENISIKILRHESNKYASAARNTGILNCKGKFLALLDSDDCWKNDYLENQLNYYKKNEHKKELDFVVFGVCNNLLEEGGWVQPVRGINPEERVEEYIFLHKQCCQTSTLFSSVDTFRNNLFDESLKALQDPSFAINAYSNGCQMKFNPNAEVLRYLDWQEGNDHVGRKLDPAFLKFWLTKHQSKMTRLGVDAFCLRYFSKNRMKLITKYIFKLNSIAILKLGCKEIIKSNMVSIYNSKIIKKMRVKIK